jgi:hypothetical protein
VLGQREDIPRCQLEAHPADLTPATKDWTPRIEIIRSML